MKHHTPRPDVSICVLNWNGREMTVDCLRSIYRHTRGVSFEIILVDNGSTDGCVSVVNDTWPEIRTIRNEKNEGFPRGNNQAIEAARGRYILLLNNDTLLTEDSISVMAQYLQDNRDVGMVGCRLRLSNGEVQRSAHSSPEWWDYLFAAVFLHRLLPGHHLFGRLNMTHQDYHGTFDADWLAAAAVMVRAEGLPEVGLLDARIMTFSEDWEWCMRWRDAGWRVVLLGETEIIHLYGMSTHSANSPTSRARKRWAIASAAASAEYVYGKRNKDRPFAVWMFKLCRRLNFATHGLLYTIWALLGREGERGRAEAYLLASVTGSRRLREQYLASPLQERSETT